MTDNQFDNLFRQRLEQHSSKVPDDMWERINKKDKDRKVFFLPRWYMIAVLLLLTGIGSYFFLQSGNSNNGTDNSLANTETLNKKMDKQATDKNHLQNDLTDTTQLNEKDKIFIIDSRKIKPGNNNIVKKNRAANKVYKKPGQEKLNDNSAALINNTLNPSLTSTTENKNNLSNDDSLKDKIAESKTFNKKDSAALSDPDENTKPGDESYNDKFSIEVYASPDLPFTNISSDNSNYEQVLKDAGKMEFSFSLGAKLSIRINKKFSARIGVQYSQVNEKMSFIDSAVTTGHITYNNHYKSVDIPLLFSYNTKWPGTLHTSFTTGALLNISSKYKGAIPDISGDAINIDHSNVYNQPAGVSLYFGIGLSKEMNKKMDVFAEPYFRYRIKNMANSIQPFNQKIHTAGVSLGVRYRLFKKED